MLKLLKCLAMAGILTAFATPAVLAKPNFAGDWKLNAAKSDFGAFPAPSAMTQKVTHEDPSMKVSTKMSTGNGDMEFESTYSTDGKETTNSFGPNSMKSTAAWEGNTLVVKTKGDFGGNELTLVDTWELSEDGKTLTLQRHWASSQGEMDQKVTFDKK